MDKILPLPKSNHYKSFLGDRLFYFFYPFYLPCFDLLTTLSFAFETSLDSFYLGFDVWRYFESYFSIFYFDYPPFKLSEINLMASFLKLSMDLVLRV
jgi:hypothetical protein